MLLLICNSCNNSDSNKNAPGNYVFIEEGGCQNRVMQNNKLIIDSGAVDFKFNKDFIVFSKDTTYSMNPSKIKKSDLIYYIYDVKKNILYREMTINEFKRIINNKDFENLDISK